MLFSLDLLKAQHGDSLLLHYGVSDDPQHLLIDGGPAGVYRRVLRPRLEELRSQSGHDTLPLSLAVVSFTDDGHLSGITDLTADLLAEHEAGRAPLVTIRELWINSLDGFLGSDPSNALLESVQAEVGIENIGSQLSAAGLRRETSSMLAAVHSARVLGQNALKLGIRTETEFVADGVVRDLGSGLRITVIAPSRERVLKLRDKWDHELRTKRVEIDAGLGGAAAYIDQSSLELSSLVLLLEMNGKRVLLTGNASADTIMERMAATYGTPPFHVDVLGLPSQGSDRNVTAELFRVIPADHYLISGNGRFGNPSPETIRLIVKARRGEPFTLWFSHSSKQFSPRYPMEALEAALEEVPNVRWPERNRTSIVLDLEEPLNM